MKVTRNTNSDKISVGALIAICLSFCTLLAVYISFVIIAAINSFASKDPKTCYYVEGLERPALTSDEAALMAMNHDPPLTIAGGAPTEYHSIFVRWFLWMFILLLAFPIVTIVSLLLVGKKVISQRIGKIFSVIFDYTYTIALTMWSGIGLHWRLG